MIFDEIDAGISGVTAAKVGEKLKLIGKSRQVICITHLSQIAAVADSHFLIEKICGKRKRKNKDSSIERRRFGKRTGAYSGWR